MSDDARRRARELCNAALAEGQPTAWFEALYREAGEGRAVVPWDDRAPNPLLVRWLDAHTGLLRPGAAALDVGCGTGDNAAELSRRGLRVTGFDVSPTAVDEARRRFGAVASFEAADVLALPAAWGHRFDLVVEVYTLQVLPPAERARAGRAIAETVAPGGTLLVVARAREEADPPGQMPWPLLRREIEALCDDTLTLRSLEDVLDDESPPVRRFVATFVRT